MKYYVTSSIVLAVSHTQIAFSIFRTIMTDILPATDPWPTLTEATNPNQTVKKEDDCWEFVTCSDGEETDVSSPMRSSNQTNILHRCPSTPEFANNSRDDSSYVLDCSSSSIDVQSVLTDASTDDIVLLSKKSPSKSTIKKVSSFKDVMMLNAQAQQKEKEENILKLKALEENMRKEAAKRRKGAKPRIVVNQIKRCIKSTGDLRSLVCIHEDEEDEGFGGGGGGGGMTIHEEAVLGDTDAAEFYFRKSKGCMNRTNGVKIRPDEAKRRDSIIAKKNAQRAAQGKAKK